MIKLLTFKQFIFEAKINKTKLDYHEVLNPKLWDSELTLLPKVKDRLNEISDMFITALDIDKKFIIDCVFTGSNTNFNYTDLSDIDIHITADFKKLKGRIKPGDYFDAMKSNWNLTHDIKIYGHDVEVYVNDKGENLVGDSSAYSLKFDKWLKEPKLQVVKYPDALIKKRASYFAKEIDKHINLHHNDKEDLEELNDKIGKMRRSGLTKQGEFSLENLVFKVLRNNNYINKLRIQIKKAEDSKLNLEGMNIMCTNLNQSYNYKLSCKDLYEDNHGVLDKDDRLSKFRDVLVTNIVNTLKKSEDRSTWFGEISIDTSSKYKSETAKNIKIEWILKNKGLDSNNSNSLIWRSSLYGDYTHFGIAFEYLRVNGMNDIQYRDAMVDFFNNKYESGAEVLHEIKHLLDKIDKIYKPILIDVYLNSLNSEAYYTSPTEKDAFLITVLQELGAIRKKNPDISYLDAIKLSKHYDIILRNLSGKNINKFKSKVAHFWHNHIIEGKDYMNSKYIILMEELVV